QRFQELLQRNPGAGVEEQLEGTRRRLNQLRLKIQQETHGGALVGHGNLGAEVFGVPGSGSASPQLPGKYSRNSQDGETGLEPSEGSGRPQIIGPEEDPEPGGANESDSVFQDLGILKSRPAHLGVFLRFLFSQADPTPLVRNSC
ncbi:ARHGB factor, partial [Zosterops hypoxanthus]|nr:ARHGB factor [Zosterops hypoxanthus]